MVFGSIIHELLEKIYISIDDSQSSELTVKTVLSLEEALELFETIFDEKSYQLSSDRIKKDAYARGRNIIELSEVSDIELHGKIDKIECEEGVIRLIDYKTGKAKNAVDKLVPPSEKRTSWWGLLAPGCILLCPPHKCRYRYF